MAQVFVSYKSDQYDFAHQVKDRIESFGYEVWIDKIDIRPGSDWQKEIDLGIESSFAVVLIISERACSESKYMIYEFAYAMGLGKKVIPLIYDEKSSGRKFHDRLAQTQHISFVRPDEVESSYQKLRDELDNTTQLANSGVIPLARKKLEQSLDSNERKHIMDQLIENNHPSVNEFFAELSQNYPWRDIPPLAGKRLAERTEFTDIRAIPGLVSGLSGVYREQCTKYLVNYGNESILYLIPILESQESTSRRQAIEIFGKLKIDESTIIQKIIELCKTDEHLRETAIIALGEIGDEAAVPLLLEFMENYLSNNDTSVRLPLVMNTFGQLKSKAAIKPLVNILSDKGLTSFWDISRVTLIHIGSYEFADVKQLFESKHSTVKKNGTMLMQYLPDLEALPSLRECLLSEDENLRFESTKAIGKIGNSEALDILIDLTADDNNNIVLIALSYIGDYKPSHILDQLHTVLQEIDLSNYEDPSSFQDNVFKSILVLRAMIEIANNTSLDIITEFLHEDFTISFQWNGSNNTSPQEQAILVLESIGTPEALEALAEWRNSQSVDE